MDVCPDLSERFLDISAQIVIIDLGVQKNAFRVDDKGPPKSKAGMFIVDAKYPGKISGRVRAHGVSHFFEHFFIPLPREMHELGVPAHGYYFGVDFFKFFVLLCQSSKFRGSYEGKIGGIEKEDSPFFCGLLGRKRYFRKVTLNGIECFKFEIRDRVSDADGAAIFRHGYSLHL